MFPRISHDPDSLADRNTAFVPGNSLVREIRVAG